MTTPSASGWDRMEAGWWPAVAEAMPKPWPRDAILFDLRYWDGQARMHEATGGRKGCKRPGRPTLARRWGVGEKRARRLMADVGAWLDPHHEDQRPEKAAAAPRPARAPAPRGQPAASEGPVRGQRGASPRDEKPHGAAPEGPARGQPGASPGPGEGPHARINTSHQTRAPTLEARAEARGDVDGAAGEDRGAPAGRRGWVVYGPDDEPPPPEPSEPTVDDDCDGPALSGLAKAVRRVLDDVVERHPEHEGEVLATATGGSPQSRVVQQLRHSLPRAGWAGELDPVALAREAREWVGAYCRTRAPKPRGEREPEPAPPMEPRRQQSRRKRRRAGGGR